MKKKENQNNTKKTLTICGLSALCIAALAGAYLLTREPDTEFVPASTETGSLTDSWEENTDVSLAQNFQRRYVHRRDDAGYQ